MPKVVPQILPSLQKLYSDSPEPTLGLPGAPAPISAYSLHDICLCIFIDAGLRPGGILLTCVRRGLFVLINLRPCALHCAAPKCPCHNNQPEPHETPKNQLESSRNRQNLLEYHGTWWILVKPDRTFHALELFRTF